MLGGEDEEVLLTRSVVDVSRVHLCDALERAVGLDGDRDGLGRHEPVDALRAGRGSERAGVRVKVGRVDQVDKAAGLELAREGDSVVLGLELVDTSKRVVQEASAGLFGAKKEPDYRQLDGVSTRKDKVDLGFLVVERNLRWESRISGQQNRLTRRSQETCKTYLVLRGGVNMVLEELPLSLGGGEGSVCERLNSVPDILDSDVGLAGEVELDRASGRDGALLRRKVDRSLLLASCTGLPCLIQCGPKQRSLHVAKVERRILDDVTLSERMGIADAAGGGPHGCGERKEGE